MAPSANWRLASNRVIQRAGPKRNLWTEEAVDPSFDDNFFSFHDKSAISKWNHDFSQL
jgi:hypothetical protein